MDVNYPSPNVEGNSSLSDFFRRRDVWIAAALQVVLSIFLAHGYDFRVEYVAGRNIVEGVSPYLGGDTFRMDDLRVRITSSGDRRDTAVGDATWDSAIFCQRANLSFSIFFPRYR